MAGSGRAEISLGQITSQLLENTKPIILLDTFCDHDD